MSSLTDQDVQAVSLFLQQICTEYLECDRTILNLLRPHLMQAYCNAERFSQMQQNLAELNQALEQSNTLILNRNGQVKLMARQAKSLLDRYF